MQYTVTLTDAENKALSAVAVSQQEWIDNVVHERCRVAMDEIVQLTVRRCLETNTPIPNSREGMVDLAFEQGWVVPAADLPPPQPLP